MTCTTCALWRRVFRRVQARRRVRVLGLNGKDLRIERRSRVGLTQIAPFAVTVLVLFGFALEGDSATLRAAFGALIAMNGPGYGDRAMVGETVLQALLQDRVDAGTAIHAGPGRYLVSPAYFSSK